MSWYQTGDEGKQRAKEEAAKREAAYRASQKLFRFWLPPDKSTQITFLDSDGFFLAEHQNCIGGDWKNWATCLRDIEGECPNCDMDNNPSYICAFTIIDHSRYVTKKGEKVIASKKVIAFKSTAQNKILKQKELQKGDLTGCKFEATRYTKKECSTGEDFNFIQRVDLLEMGEALKTAGVIPDDVTVEEFIKPVDYLEYFKPLSINEMKSMLGVAPAVGSADSGGSSHEGGSTISDLI